MQSDLLELQPQRDAVAALGYIKKELRVERTTGELGSVFFATTNPNTVHHPQASSEV
jgi:hypothetical protein